MDDTLCRRFFLAPQGSQRRYEVLRAFFVERLSYETIADRFATPYHTVRALVRDFRAECRAGQVPPLLPCDAADVPPATARQHQPLAPRRPRPPIAGA